MGDWTSFQEDFWKVLSTLGINHDNDVDPKATVPKPENDAKEQKNPDVTSRHGHEAESAQRGVWDSRIPHPVPSYPVMDASIRSIDSPALQMLKFDARSAE